MIVLLSIAISKMCCKCIVTIAFSESFMVMAANNEELSGSKI